jgi:hypothetical protein
MAAKSWRAMGMIFQGWSISVFQTCAVDALMATMARRLNARIGRVPEVLSRGIGSRGA